MYAIQVQTDQPDRPLIWQETPDPPYGPDEVLVDIHATALNRADLLQRAGQLSSATGCVGDYRHGDGGYDYRSR